MKSSDHILEAIHTPLLAMASSGGVLVLACHFGPSWFAGVMAVLFLPVDREARKYRPIGGDEFMFMYSDDDGHWLKHSGTRNYLLVRRDATIAVIVGKHGEPFLGGFYGDAPSEVGT